jgi:hypothetical protein
VTAKAVSKKKDAAKRAGAIFFLMFVFGMFVFDSYFAKGSGFVRDVSGKYALASAVMLATISAAIAYVLKLR